MARWLFGPLKDHVLAREVKVHAGGLFLGAIKAYMKLYEYIAEGKVLLREYLVCIICSDFAGCEPALQRQYT